MARAGQAIQQCTEVRSNMILEFQNQDNIMTAPWNDGGTRYIYILLARYPDAFSTALRFITQNCFSHASIGLSDSDGLFYSYVTKGFRKEFPQMHPTYKGREIPCSLYCLEISDEVHSAAKAILEEHANRADDFKYNLFGVLLCLLRIANKKKSSNKYFCSQFVSEILEQLSVVPLVKHSTLYRPDDFTHMKGLDLQFAGYLSELAGLSTPILTT